jgi:2-oxoacid:acceptor oxidoreductase delta subunit (pyruvate/2-ketoisovalerate family)
MTEKPFAITLDVGSSRANHTGSWRAERPVYVDRLSPCAGACPAGEDPQAWLYHAESGDYLAAWRAITAVNPFPAIMGRVCFAPCEGACNRAQLDETVGINAIERFLGDEAIRLGWALDPPRATTGKRVLVVGAGPSGLAAAYHLARRGHDVTVRDAGEQAGGMMRYGIPRYRLPREVLDAEVARITALGVHLELGHHVADLDAAIADGAFDAAFVAVGAQVGKHADIPAGDTARILDAVALLRATEDDTPPLLGRRVAVYGGGDTAMDAARTARRLGATEAVIIYRRTRERMPAHDLEVQEAVEEGVRMRWLSTVRHVDAGTIVIEKMALDDEGFPQPTGELEELEADALVLALGQDTDLTLLDDLSGVEIASGVVVVDEQMMTGRSGVFAGGDMVPAERTVTTAVGHGRRAAAAIHAYLVGTEPTAAPTPQLATFARLNTWYFSDAPKTMRPHLDAARRQTSFAEVTGGLDEHSALFEARRCLSCGTCFECDNCYGVCPDNAVIKLGPGERYAIDLDYCKGCGICAAECPCGAIEMVPEER